MDNDDTQPPTETPALTPTPPALRTSRDCEAHPTGPADPTPTRDRVLDLVALLLLTALSAAVFVLAGPGAFTAVTSAGMGLFATWRSRR